MIIRLEYMHQLETLYQCYGIKGQSGVIWGHRGQKAKFTKKYYKSLMLHTIINKLMQMHHLETPYQYYAKVRGHFRSEGSRGQIHQKCY